MAIIPLKQLGRVVAGAVIDDADFERVTARSWRLHARTGYAIATTTGSEILMHREVLGLTKGDGLMVDHINREKLDNRRANLRLVTYSQSSQNRVRPSGKHSRFRGVTKQRGRRQANGCVNQRYYHLGFFDTEEEAAKAALAWRIEHLPYAELETLLPSHDANNPLDRAMLSFAQTCIGGKA